MRIGIDVRPTERPASRNRGIGLYTRSVCDALQKRNCSLGQPHEFAIIDSRRVPAIRKPSRLQWMVDTWMLPRVLREEKIEIFHAMEFTSIPALKRPKVIAHVHDMIPFVFWQEYSKRIPMDFRWALQVARKRLAEAACVVTVSEHSKKDIIELTGYPEDRIYVAYEGAPETQRHEDTKTQSTRPYFLYVGGTDFRKNVLFLIRAFAQLAEREKDIWLMLVGETFMMTSLREVAEILDEVSRLGIADRVVTMGYVDENKLTELYRRSLALVFPSLYEGFGLPVLEAMAYGTPVLAARTSSIPEVLGETGVYFDPRDEDSLIAALEDAYRNPAGLSELAKKAQERARSFTWNKVADTVLGIYPTL
jgi:glycosyltransferase involved in cell wall biosynthesis